MTTPLPYIAAALQTAVVAARHGRSAVWENLDRIDAALGALTAEFPDDLRLVVIPEYCLSGYHPGLDASQWAILAPAFGDGSTHDALPRLTQLARAHGIFLAGATYATDLDWPGQVVSRGFLLDPDGQLLLSTLKHSPDVETGLSALATPADRWSPGERWDPPVVTTEIGQLGLVIGDDVRHPDYVRALVQAGCEILLHPGAGRADGNAHVRQLSRQARASENLAWLVGAVAGTLERDAASLELGRESLIVDHDAEIVSGPGPAGPGYLAGWIDLHRSRQARAAVFGNFPAQLRTRLYAGPFAALPDPGPAPQPITTRAERLDRGRATIQLMADRGLWPAPSASQPVRPYQAMLAQTRIRFIDDVARAGEVIQENLQRSLRSIAAVAEGGVKLVTFPEYWLQGAAMNRSVEDWLKVGLRIPGPETDVLAEFAAKHGLYLAGAAFEVDPDWPGRFFNCGFIIGPDGGFVLKYRKLHCGDVGGLLPVSTPGQVLSEYRARYGDEALFPVADTPIGRLSVMICHEGSFPELHRVKAWHGAEVICYPTGDAAASRNARWDVGAVARAADHAFYFLHVNSGAEVTKDGAPDTHFHKGHSRLIDFEGRILVEAHGNGEVPLTGTIDIEALRRFRSDPRRNPLAHHRPAMYAQTYADGVEGTAVDTNLDQPPGDLMACIAQVQAGIGRFQDAGVYLRP